MEFDHEYKILIYGPMGIVVASFQFEDEAEFAVTRAQQDGFSVTRLWNQEKKKPRPPI